MNQSGPQKQHSATPRALVKRGGLNHASGLHQKASKCKLIMLLLDRISAKYAASGKERISR